MAEKLQAILFDFGGTLDSDGTDWFTRIYEAINRGGGGLARSDYDSWAERAAQQIGRQGDISRLNMDETARRLCETLYKLMHHNGGPAPVWQVEEVVEEFMDQARQYLRRNRQVIKTLQNKYRLGVISNNWGNTAGWCRQFDMTSYFATIIDSHVVGCSKPELRIFQAALAELQLPAEVCAYVGDRYECDMAGAQAAGLIPVWLTQQSEYIPGGGTPTTIRRISKLPDLLQLDIVRGDVGRGI